MSTFVARLAAGLGSLVFVVSFFLPPESDRTPVEILKWTLDTTFTSDAVGQTLMFGALSMIILYPPVWAVASIAASAGWGRWSWMRAPWLYLAIHTAGGGMLLAVSLVLLWIHDSWIPAFVPVAGVVLPAVILVPLWLVGVRMRREWRTGAVMALGHLLMLLMVAVMAVVCSIRGEPSWGFWTGVAGAALAAGGSLGLCLGGTSDRRA